MELTFNRLFTYLIPYLLGGISVTLSVSFLALVIGAVGGLLLAFLRVYGGRAVQVLMTCLLYTSQWGRKEARPLGAVGVGRGKEPEDTDQQRRGERRSDAEHGGGAEPQQ